MAARLKSWKLNADVLRHILTSHLYSLVLMQSSNKPRFCSPSDRVVLTCIAGTPSAQAGPSMGPQAAAPAYQAPLQLQAPSQLDADGIRVCSKLSLSCCESPQCPRIYLELT